MMPLLRPSRPAAPSLREATVGTIVTVVSANMSPVSITNDRGGTTWLPDGVYRIRITKRWHDYETGFRFIGVLLDDSQLNSPLHE